MTMSDATNLMSISFSFAEQLLIAAVIGAASGAIGSFILLKRMALVGDALSHVALPRIALALAYHLDPFLAVIAALLVASPLIWWLEVKSDLPTEALVGLLFTASLALGILTIPDSEILESLFGAFPALSLFEFSGTIGTAAVMIVCTFLLARPFLFRIISAELARSCGVGRSYDLALLVIFSVIVALGIKLVGTLLMGALTIIPAAIARNMSLGMKKYMLLAAAIGALISTVGLSLAAFLTIRPGPAIVLLGVVVFVISLTAMRRKR